MTDAAKSPAESTENTPAAPVPADKKPSEHGGPQARSFNKENSEDFHVKRESDLPLKDGSDSRHLPKQRPDVSANGDPIRGPEPTRYGDWEIGGKCVDF